MNLEHQPHYPSLLEKMWSSRKRTLILQIVLTLIFLSLQSIVTRNSYNFVVHEAGYTRLCSTKSILTVNGQFPGPTIRVHEDETIYVNVYNSGRYNITLHWHGVKQPRNPWADGPEYITQCPIQPGGQFRQRVIFAMEVGTVWWHAHSDWLRATVHGAIIVYPKEKPYPFPAPDVDVPIVLAEWWKSDVVDVFNEFVRSGGEPNVSDAITVNGQPGDLYPCSQSETFRLSVDPGKRYLLRIVNAAMNTVLFFSVAKHNLTVVGSDGSYTKPITSDYIVIAPGQSMDVLLYATQTPDRYYMAARAYVAGQQVSFDNSTATAIVQYTGYYQPSPSPPFPSLPYYNDSASAFRFINSLRSLANDDFPADVPLNVSINMVSTVSINSFPCSTNDSCAGPNGTRLAASMTNISFLTPGNLDILEAYYYTIKGDYNTALPDNPPLIFNFTADSLPLEYEIPDRGTRVKVLPFGAAVELVFQGTSLFGGIEHPMHLHGFDFYVVGNGTGNFDRNTDPLNYNLVDPPRLNSVTVPRNGWSAIRFVAQNPGVWFMHCHFDRHLTWGMETVFIVNNGSGANESVLPPPPDMPIC